MPEEKSLIDLFHEKLGKDLPIQLPPKVFEELGFKFVRYEPLKLIVCAFPAHQRFANPMGMYSGGIIGAAFDTVFGSLAALITERPCTTVTLEQQFIRPLPADGQEFTIEVRTRAVRNAFVFLDGTAKDANAKLFATASTTMAPFKIPSRKILEAAE